MTNRHFHASTNVCDVAVVVVVRISLSHPHEYKEAEEIRAKMEREGGPKEKERRIGSSHFALSSRITSSHVPSQCCTFVHSSYHFISKEIKDDTLVCGIS